MRLASRWNWSVGIFVIVSAVMTGAATILTAAGTAQHGAWRYVAAIAAAVPGIVLALQRALRADAKVAWHTERARRLEAVRRAMHFEGLPLKEASERYSAIEADLEARWQSVGARDGEGKTAWDPMKPPTTPARSTARRERADDEERFRERVQQTIVSDANVERLRNATDPAAVLKELNNVASQVAEEATKALSVSVRGFETTKQISLVRLDTFDAFTDEVYYAFADHLRPYRYGTDWRLTVDGKPICHARESTKAAPGIAVEDNRALSDLGIRPGVVLELQDLVTQTAGKPRP